MAGQAPVWNQAVFADCADTEEPLIGWERFRLSVEGVSGRLRNPPSDAGGGIIALSATTVVLVVEDADSKPLFSLFPRAPILDGLRVGLRARLK